MAHQLHAQKPTDSLMRHHNFAKLSAKGSDKDLMDAIKNEVKTEDGMSLEELMSIVKWNS